MDNIKIGKLGVIVDQSYFLNKQDGSNINGPSLLKVPDFIKNPLGKYYLYFGHHNGAYIRMAYSNDIIANYKIYEGGVLNLSQLNINDKNFNNTNHIASPDVIVDNENKKLIMYFHCPYNNKLTSQSTFYATSIDGLTFTVHNEHIIYPYFRYFIYNNEEYGLAMNKIENSSYTSVMKRNFMTNKFEEINQILPNSRHTCVTTINEKIYVCYSIVGDCPEHIYMCELEINNLNLIRTKNTFSLIAPELQYEHSNKKPTKSEYGISHNAVCQLRDPYVYIENNNIYILYTVSGEKGIAIAVIYDL